MAQFINEIPAFLLLLVRVTSFFAMMPIFSYRTIPNTHKVGLAVFLALLIHGSLDLPIIEIDGTYFLLIIKEAMVGLVVGMIAFLIMSAIQIAGGFIDFQMGFAIANVIDPQTGAQSPIIGQYLYIFALLLLLSVNGHHLLLDGIFFSYQIIPLEQLFLQFGNESYVQFIAQTFNGMFIVAFQMAIPVVGSLFLVDIGLGIIARTVPQLNVFVVGLPLKILVSFILLIIVMPIFMMLFQNLFESMFYAMRGLMGLIGGD